MKIAFHCACGKRYVVPNSMAGRNAKCKRCGIKLLIPGQWNEELDSQPPGMLGPFGFVSFLFGLAAVGCGILLPWMAVNLVIQVAAILFACVVLLVAGYYHSGFAMPLLAILLAFGAFLQVLIMPDALDRLARFRTELKERTSDNKSKDDDKPKGTQPDSKPWSTAPNSSKMTPATRALPLEG